MSFITILALGVLVSANSMAKELPETNLEVFSNPHLNLQGSQILNFFRKNPNHNFLNIDCSVNKNSREYVKIAKSIHDHIVTWETQSLINKFKTDQLVQIGILNYPEEIQALMKGNLSSGNYKSTHTFKRSEKKYIKRSDVFNFHCGIGAEDLPPLKLNEDEFAQIRNPMLQNSLEKLSHESQGQVDLSDQLEFKDLKIRDIELNPAKYKLDLVALTKFKADLLVYIGNDLSFEHPISQSEIKYSDSALYSTQAPLKNTSCAVVRINTNEVVRNYMIDQFKTLNIKMIESTYKGGLLLWHNWIRENSKIWLGGKDYIRCEGDMKTIGDFEEALYPHFTIKVKIQ